MRKIMLVVVTSIAVSFAAHAQDKFPHSKGDMPFSAEAVKRPIDHDCPPEGTGKSDPQQAQNAAKNNFSATGTPVSIRITDFDRLERSAIIARNCAAKHKQNCHRVEIDSEGLPTNREQLKDIATTEAGDTVGEGTLVVLVAKVLNSHYSNTKYSIFGQKRSQGESVNCKGVPSLQASSELDRNDIHIVLAAPGVNNECLSVTAEISPHFRPESWQRFHNMGPNKFGEDPNDEIKGVDFRKLRAVRITGPLFYDASHEACSAENQHASPARRSIWEVHPVYNLEVQTEDGHWLNFDNFAATQ